MPPSQIVPKLADEGIYLASESSFYRVLSANEQAPSVSDDNVYSESFFRTLKYIPTYPSKPFESIEAARQWVHLFATWYNQSHRHSGLKFVTPAQCHKGEDTALLAKRHAVYEMAKTRNPSRWTGSTRNWQPCTEVWLNPQNAPAEALHLDKTA